MNSSTKVLLICILALLLIIINLQDFNYYYNDIIFKTKQVYLSIIYHLLNNNLLETPINKVNKVAIVTFENRKNEEFINLHNKNITEYCKKWNYDYLFYDKCINNVYWCKMFLVLDALKTNKYDYVIWLDSDTIIKKMDVSIDSIVNKYSSDIFVNYDNGDSLFCAGVFFIKNSEIGKLFMEECIKYYQPHCVNNTGDLNGMWAGLCYEQGIMNKLIVDSFYKYTTCLPNNIVLNKKINSSMSICNYDTFILHLYNSPNSLRAKCFSKYI